MPNCFIRPSPYKITVDFQDFSVGNLIDRNSRERHSFVGGRHTQKLSAVGAGNGPIHHQLVALADGIVHDELQVRQSCEKAFHLPAVC